MAKVYIGVGHGGTDPGAVSQGFKEKDIALAISTACTAELRRHGVSVLQSRTADATETAAAKIAECNAYGPDIALDIHLNAGGGDGFEVFHSVVGGKGKELAAKIEAAVKAIGQNSRGLKTKKNSKGKDYFGIIRQTSCPACLVECAFIDSKDVQAVDTAAEQKAFGVAIAHGVLAYLGIKVQAAAPSAGTAAKPQQGAAVMLPLLAAGSKGPAVKALQLLLGGYGLDLGAAGADGIYGSKTSAAVGAYQKRRGLPVTGAADAETWKALLSLGL